MSDLVERLRDFVRVYDSTEPALTANIHPVICRCGRCYRDFTKRAADEIERLEKEISDADSSHSKTLIEFGKLRIQNERFRQALLAITNQVTVDYLLSDKDIARLALGENK